MEELHVQRLVEYERLTQGNSIEFLKRERPGIFLKLISATFGLASLQFGLLLTIFIFLAILS